jgi:hypothetical protein
VNGCWFSRHQHSVWFDSPKIWWFWYYSSMRCSFDTKFFF